MAFLTFWAKLGILQALVAQALNTDLIRKKLDEYVEQQQVLASTRREEALEEGRKRRQDKELLKTESHAKEIIEGRSGESVGSSSNTMLHGNYSRQNGYGADKWNKDAVSSPGKHASENIIKLVFFREYCPMSCIEYSTFPDFPTKQETIRHPNEKGWKETEG